MTITRRVTPDPIFASVDCVECPFVGTVLIDTDWHGADQSWTCPECGEWHAWEVAP